MIRKKRPDLLPKYVHKLIKPTSDIPPAGFFCSPNIPDIGELMLACFKSYGDIVNNWWMGEKYDGVRACWNPKKLTYYSRQGRELSHSVRYPCYKVIPICFLDGEFWIGRQNFQLVLQIVLDKELEATLTTKFPLLKFLVFDSPSPLLANDIFETRYLYMLINIHRSHPSISINSRVACGNRMSINSYLKLIMYNKTKQGEGIILRKPNSLYEHGKSQSILKVKAVRDVDALVVDIKKNYYICKLPHNEEVIATKAPELFVKCWDVVSFSVIYKKNEHKNVHKIVSVRHDLLWDDCVYY